MSGPGDIPAVFEQGVDGFLISTERSRLELDTIAGFLARSYWASTRQLEVIERSIAHSLCFGVYRVEGQEAGESAQVGFARVISDFATYAYLCDVYIAEEARGIGLGKRLIETVVAHPDLQDLRRWTLATADAHELYRPFGFSALAAPDRWMEKL